MTEGTQGVQAPIDVVEEIKEVVNEPVEVKKPKKEEPEKAIISLVSEICHDIDIKLLSDYLVSRDWNMILGPKWSHLKTNEDKACMLASQARATISRIKRPKK